MPPPVDSVSYDPLSRLPGLDSELLARLDRTDFPARIDRRLAGAIDRLERRYPLTLIVYGTAISRNACQLCRYLCAAEVGADAMAELRRLEIAFGVRLVAYDCGRPIAPLEPESSWTA